MTVTTTPAGIVIPPQLLASGFLLVGCQGGAEPALERRQQQCFPELRKAVWRRGLVSFRLPASTEATDNQTTAGWPQAAVPARLADRLVFARTAIRSLGQVTGENAQQLVNAAGELIGDAAFAAVHVWKRDLRLAFETEPVHAALAAASGLASEPTPLPAGSLILDCVIDTADRWWIGWHQACTPAASWPGGRYPGSLPADAVSRAWLKLDEAVALFEIPFEPGQRACELGAAPGGAAQRLLAAGLEVIGIDPASIDPRVADQPRFTHWQKRARDVRVKDLRGCDWLVTDMNIDPTSTMAALERILKTSGRRPQGVIATLKLPDWSRANDLDGWLSRFASWGYQPRVRQLSTGGRELCLVALRRGRRPGRQASGQSAGGDAGPVQT